MAKTLQQLRQSETIIVEIIEGKGLRNCWYENIVGRQLLVSDSGDGKYFLYQDIIEQNSIGNCRKIEMIHCKKNERLSKTITIQIINPSPGMWYYSAAIKGVLHFIVYSEELGNSNLREKYYQIAEGSYKGEPILLQDCKIVGGSKETVNHPAHYGGENNPYEAIKVIEAWELGFNLGNTIKYISRAGKKDASIVVNDLEKASWYLNREIEKIKKQQS